MAVYSVLEPPPRASEDEAAPERFVFVRDGFRWGPFLFGGLWMLWRRLWLVFFGYLVLLIALGAVLGMFRMPVAVHFAVGFLIALLIGLEAASLQRWSLIRAGWRDRGIVVADDIEAAERRFFVAWTADGLPARTARTAPAAPGFAAQVPAAASAGVVGLFPQPGGSR